MADFLDPAPILGEYEPIADALEKATDRYVAALNREAVAENGYRKALSLAYSMAGDVAATARRFHCEMQPEVVEALCDYNDATAAVKVTAAKCDELRNRLMAAMNWQRLVGAQT